MTTRWRATAAALLVAGVVLGACSGGGQEPSRSLPDPTTASATPTLPPLGPADFPMPEEAREQTPEGAGAFLRYYLELLTREQGLNGEWVLRLSKGCELCSALGERFDEDFAAGYVVSGGVLTITSSSAPLVRDDVAEFAFIAEQSPVTVETSGGQAVPGRGQGELSGLNSAAALQWSSDDRSWVVTQLIFE